MCRSSALATIIMPGPKAIDRTQDVHETGSDAVSGCAGAEDGA